MSLATEFADSAATYPLLFLGGAIRGALALPSLGVAPDGYEGYLTVERLSGS